MLSSKHTEFGTAEFSIPDLLNATDETTQKVRAAPWKWCPSPLLFESITIAYLWLILDTVYADQRYPNYHNSASYFDLIR